MYSITMNNNESFVHFAPIEMKEILDAHVNHMLADQTIVSVGPVVEIHYDVHTPRTFHNVTVPMGIHVIALNPGGYPIAYQGPGED